MNFINFILIINTLAITIQSLTVGRLVREIQRLNFEKDLIEVLGKKGK